MNVKTPHKTVYLRGTSSGIRHPKQYRTVPRLVEREEPSLEVLLKVVFFLRKVSQVCEEFIVRELKPRQHRLALTSLAWKTVRDSGLMSIFVFIFSLGNL